MLPVHGSPTHGWAAVVATGVSSGSLWDRTELLCWPGPTAPHALPQLGLLGSLLVWCGAKITLDMLGWLLTTIFSCCCEMAVLYISFKLF